MKRRTFFCVSIATIVCSAAIDRSSAQNPQWGDVQGQVVWVGANPAPVAFPAAGGCPAGAVMPQIVNPKNKGLKYVFVWLEPPQKGAPLPINPNLAAAKPKVVDVDQPKCEFEPPSVALREGDTLLAKNSSVVVHNFRYTGDPTVNPGGGFILQPKGQQAIPDPNAGIAALKASRLPVVIECNIHPWMRGWVRVFDHPYFALTNDDGNFTIKDAPAGNFRLKVWASEGWAGGVAGKNGIPIAIQPGVNNVPPINYP